VSCLGIVQGCLFVNQNLLRLRLARGLCRPATCSLMQRLAVERGAGKMAVRRRSWHAACPMQSRNERGI
jgi:hypothetical protein